MTKLGLASKTIIAFTTLVVLTAPSRAQNVVVPNVVGQKVEAAQKALNAVGLKSQAFVGMYLGPGDSRLGSVHESQPGAGTRIPRGNSVALFYFGVAPAVPNVVGLHYRDAQAKLKAAGFPPAKLVPGGQVAAGDPKLGIVISQAPTGFAPRRAPELRIWVLKPAR